MRLYVRNLTLITLIPCLGLLAACGSRVSEEPLAAEPAAPPAAPAPAAAAATTATGPAASAAKESLVVFLGDSLTAGLGLPAEQAYPALVEQTLDREGLPVRVLNAGVSGDTTAGGLSRLDWLLQQKPGVVVVGLGANDGLRGLDLADTERNLRQIVRRSQASGARVLLLGMQIPPNYGPDYAGRFKDLYPRLAEEMDVPLVPFLLEGVGGVPELNQADGIHPNPEGQVRVAENVVPHLEDVVRGVMVK
ncbi:MAG TPA: arylesterase [Thermoanaerobaculia bacterium]|nr:arylesterase [Thermoanaerobaculia bacterium]